MPGKLDDISEAIGQLRAQLAEVMRRQDHRDLAVEQHHKENQESARLMRTDMQGALSELRDTANKRYEESVHAMADLTLEVKGQGDKLDEHAREVKRMQPQIAALQMGRGKLAILAAIGVGALAVVVWAIEAGVHW